MAKLSAVSFRPHLLGLTGVLLAALIIGCGGDDSGAALPPTTGSTAGQGGSTAGSTGGTPGETFTNEVAAITLAFTEISATNARTTTLRDVADYSGLGYTQKGVYATLIAENGDGSTREFSFDVPIEMETGRSYTYTSEVTEPRIVADYDEVSEDVDGPSKTWRAASGTVRVIERTATDVTLQFEDMLFRPSPAVEGEENDATGTFTVSGTVRFRYVPIEE